MRATVDITLACLLLLAVGGCVNFGFGPMPAPGPVPPGTPLPAYPPATGTAVSGLPGTSIEYPRGYRGCSNFRKYKPDCAPRSGSDSGSSSQQADGSEGDGNSAPASAQSAAA